MVATALCRGNLHRVSNTPCLWPPPSPSLSSSQFRSLLRRRSLALSCLSSPPPPTHDDTEDDAKEKEDNHSVSKEEQQQQKQEVVEEEQEEREIADSDSTDNPSHLDLPLPVKKEEEILNAEEEMKRRINPSTVTHGSGGPDAPSASILGLGRMSVVVNFGTDLGRESDPGSTQSAHTRPFCQMENPSPSGSSLSRSPSSHNPRAPQASSSVLGNPLTSPARFVHPTGQLGHVSSLRPRSIAAAWN